MPKTNNTRKHGIINIFSSLLEHPLETKFSLQENDEQIELLMRRHPITNFFWIFLSLLFFLVPIILPFLDINVFATDLFKALPVSAKFVIPVLWYTVLCGLTLTFFLNWFFNVYIVTNKRLIDVDYYGLFFHRISDCHLDQVQDITHDVHGIWEITFNYGDVYVQTASEAAHIDFNSVANPQFVHQRISELSSNYKRAHKIL